MPGNDMFSGVKCGNAKREVPHFFKAERRSLIYHQNYDVILSLLVKLQVKNLRTFEYHIMTFLTHLSPLLNPTRRVCVKQQCNTNRQRYRYRLDFEPFPLFTAPLPTATFTRRYFP